MRGWTDEQRENTAAFLRMVIRAADAGYWALHCDAKPGLDSEARHLLCLLRDEARRQERAVSSAQMAADVDLAAAARSPGEAARTLQEPCKDPQAGEATPAPTPPEEG